MDLKIFSKSFKIFQGFLIIGIALFFPGCAPSVLTPASTVNQGVSQQSEDLEKTYEKPSPRVLAALQLTEQGRLFIENNRPDDAIGVLERALNLNPSNGRNYYYLSEAWFMKGNIEQATEFNRLAQTYLYDDSDWLDRVMQQKERIKKRKR